MSYPAYPPPPRKPLPASVATPKPLMRRRNTGFLIAALLVLFVLASAVTLELFLPCFKSLKESQKVADLFLRDLEKQRYKSAEKRTIVHGEGDSQFDDLRSTMKRIQKRRGKVIGHTGPERQSIGSINDPQDVRLEYRVKYKNGSSASVVLTLSSRANWDGRWNIEDMEFK